MEVRVEAYTATGVVTGVLARAEHLREALDGTAGLVLREATAAGLDGAASSPRPELVLDVDEVILAASDEPVPDIGHAAWHEVALRAGPYRIDGELATMPGFDAGRAITRPTGEFVHLRDVRLGLLERPEIGAVPFATGLVNRYLVDTVRSDLELGFFFPGAHVDEAAPPAGTDGPAARP